MAQSALVVSKAAGQNYSSSIDEAAQGGTDADEGVLRPAVEHSFDRLNHRFRFCQSSGKANYPV